MSDKDLQIQYALICSVEAENMVPKLVEFSGWFLEKVKNEAKTIGLFFDFNTIPSCSTYVKPGDLDGCVKAYENIHHNFPFVQVVIHILPEKESDEYEWMKSLAARFSLVRQGILVHNAINRFDNADLDEVLRNVSQWISRSFHKICSSKDVTERAFDLRVGSGNPVSLNRGYDSQCAQSAVNAILHGSISTSFKEDSSVRVEGFPRSLNEFGVSQLFGSLTVTGVTIIGNSAVVTFSNKFHAFHAAKMNDMQIDRIHKLRVTPLSQEVQTQIGIRTA